MSSSSSAGEGFDARFAAFYLQTATRELSEDLNQVRNAEDFKGDSVSFLVDALRQGANQFSAEDKKRILSQVQDKNP
ncbi:hypothetical protein HIM_04807 [Hirsutella minnesotensis 3608]|uniref:Ribosome assembly protein 3 n=1 Tax=Hirsutella minnesotensis 3608 TaxID=1043627 RepID=A0A0F7ZPK3_9HYPO|nr:hypothetical protein HIM_04807 [Hirsutella minnesotensis 3608]